MRIQQLLEHRKPVASVCYQPSTEMLLCGTATGEVIGYGRGGDIYEPVFHLHTGLSVLSRIVVHPQEGFMAVSGKGMVEMWDIERGMRLWSKVFPEGVGLGRSMVFHPVRRSLLFGGYDYDILSLGLERGDTQELFSGMEFNACFAVHPGGKIIASSYVVPQDGAGVGFLGYPNEDKGRMYDDPHIVLEREVQPYIAFAGNGSQLAMAYTDIAAWQTMAEIEQTGAILGQMRVYSFPDCEKVVDVPLVGELANLERLGALYKPSDSVSNIVVLAGGRYAACGTSAGTVALLHCEHGVIEQYFPVSSAAIVALAAAGDNTLIVVCEHGTIAVCAVAERDKAVEGKGDIYDTEEAFWRTATEGEW